MIAVELIKLGLAFLLKHKGKLVLLVCSAMLFIFVLFPFDDLGELVSSEVSKMTNNGVFLSFDRMRLSVVPDPGIELQKVYIESLSTPALSARELVILPSLSGIIKQKPFGSVSAKGFMKGDLDVKMDGGPRSDKGNERVKIELKGEKLSLFDLKQFLSTMQRVDLPTFKGNAQVSTQILADLSFKESPEISELNLNINQFELLPKVYEMVGLEVPHIKLSQLDIKSRMNEGKLYIENGVLGKGNDEIVGTIKGFFTLNPAMAGNNLSYEAGAYELTVDIKVKATFYERAKLLFIQMDQYKTPVSDGYKFHIKIRGDNFRASPSFSPALG